MCSFWSHLLWSFHLWHAKQHRSITSSLHLTYMAVSDESTVSSPHLFCWTGTSGRCEIKLLIHMIAWRRRKFDRRCEILGNSLNYFLEHEQSDKVDQQANKTTLGTDVFKTDQDILQGHFTFKLLVDLKFRYLFHLSRPHTHPFSTLLCRLTFKTPLSIVGWIKCFRRLKNPSFFK